MKAAEPTPPSGEDELLAAAWEARAGALCPFSKFAVGAAILDGAGRVRGERGALRLREAQAVFFILPGTNDIDLRHDGSSRVAAEGLRESADIAEATADDAPDFARKVLAASPASGENATLSLHELAYLQGRKPRQISA